MSGYDITHTPVLTTKNCERIGRRKSEIFGWLERPFDVDGDGGPFLMSPFYIFDARPDTSGLLMFKRRRASFDVPADPFDLWLASGLLTFLILGRPGRRWGQGEDEYVEYGLVCYQVLGRDMWCVGLGVDY